MKLRYERIHDVYFVPDTANFDMDKFVVVEDPSNLDPDVVNFPLDYVDVLPGFELAAADESAYMQTRKTLDTLSQVSASTREWTEKIKAHQDTILFNDMNVLMLPGSRDIVHITYLPIDRACDGDGLAIVPVCPTLRKLRSVALTFHYCWLKKSHRGPCPDCGEMHNQRPEIVPIHMIQFIARCLPHVENVYIIDNRGSERKVPLTVPEETETGGSNPDGFETGEY